MGQEARAGVAPALRVGYEGATATHVVDVSVGVDEAVDRSIRPLSQCGDHRRSGLHAAGVPAHQSLAGVHHPAVGERFDDRHVVLDHRELMGHPVVGRLRHP